ncbi:MAG: ABC transporter substrate-binding protein, partial [Kaistella sp.]|nr:ABC transporter substrate-binding protein [Kaistella sp.]
DVEELQKYFKVLVTNISTLEDNYYLLKNLGNILNRQETAQKFNIKIYEVFQNFSDLPKKKCAYLIWQNPYMTVGSDTFIHDILDKVGFENIFKHHKRYPEITVEELKAAEFIFLSTEPFPFKQTHVEELQKQLPDSKVLLVDGEAFSWYGTRLAKCENYFKGLVEKCQ